MIKLINWAKQNKLLLITLLVLVYLLFKNSGLKNQLSFNSLLSPETVSRQKAASPGMDEGLGVTSMPAVGMPAPDYEPQPEAEDRLVIEQSNLSLVVDNVRQKADQVIDQAESKGGYMVSNSISQPEEVAFATVVVRIPQAELRNTLEVFRQMAIKVSSEYLSGQDVTDEYMDIGERLNTLAKTKAKFEEIMNQAVKIDDILRVQRELINLQSQIDSLKGRQDYLSKTAENAKLTVYLSTDEWSLPYTPQAEAFRPKVIFKQAVRSLVSTGRGLAKALIWLLVYSPIWLAILVAFYLIKKRRK